MQQLKSKDYASTHFWLKIKQWKILNVEKEMIIFYIFTPMACIYYKNIMAKNLWSKYHNFLPLIDRIR